MIELNILPEDDQNIFKLLIFRISIWQTWPVLIDRISSCELKGHFDFNTLNMLKAIDINKKKIIDYHPCPPQFFRPPQFLYLCLQFRKNAHCTWITVTLNRMVFTVICIKQRSKVVKDWYGCVVRDTNIYPPGLLELGLKKW
jgi:hypothetical protein